MDVVVLVLFMRVVEDRYSMWAGLRRSMETVSWRPLRCGDR